MPPFGIIAFDADDTLWHNERLYVQAQAKLKELLRAYLVDEHMDERLYSTEMRNLEHFGYGIKAFALSMIETAIELTDGRISARDIGAIMDSARQMMTADVELLSGAREAVSELSTTHELMLITKGDLLDQERKIARSGLAEYFRYVEIVSDKNLDTYRALMQRHDTPPARFLMVGNSLRSDILPVLELGASAVYVPHELIWVHETADLPPALPAGFHQIERLDQLPKLIEWLERETSPNRGS